MSDGSGPSRRERLHDATREEIKTIARRHMAEQGTAAISLRGIAREMGLTAPALYRYFADRDELITALIVDAYNAVADALLVARDAAPAATPPERLLAAMLAYRSWALAHPADYALILGNPIPGYQTPSEITTPVARRTLVIFLDLIEASWQSGLLTAPAEYTELLPRFQQQIIGGPKHYGAAMPHPALELVLATWGKLHGLISVELFGHLQPIVGDPGALYRFEALALLAQMGFKST